MALTISQLVNDYGSYSGKTLIGDLGSRGNVPGGGFGGVRGVPYDNITFIVKVNGTRYASSRWLSQQQNGNPYIHSTSVARIDLQDIPYAPIEDITDIRGVPKNMTGNREAVTLKLGEQFAEVNATSNLTTDDAILSFINDLLSESPDVKPWDNYGNFEPKIYTGTPPGKPPDVPDFIENKLGEPFPVGVTTPFGGTYNPELDMKGLYPGMEFRPKKISLFGVFGEEARALSIPKTTEVADVKEIPIPQIKIEPIEIGPLNIGDINDFYLNDSIEFTREILSTPDGLAMTGLKDQYDTGILGPMAAIMDELDANERDNLNKGYSPFGGFN